LNCRTAARVKPVINDKFLDQRLQQDGIVRFRRR
jgi:hypothetical protein